VSVTRGVEVRRDLRYASVDGRPLLLDLYLPEGAGDECPVVLYLHGGAFMVGSKANNSEERLIPVARSGIAIASAAYRFSDVATYPAQVHDAKAAVRWRAQVVPSTATAASASARGAHQRAGTWR
jgi:acetyl esterase/lipase